MHIGNRHLWAAVKADHPTYFKTKRVLEAGSMNINGTLRDFFEECDYTGIDFRKGDGVDVVTLCHEMTFVEPFDVVISGQMLEHDPFWEKSIKAMVAHLKPIGVLLLSWGPAHAAPETGEWAPDGGFHPLPAGKVIRLVRGLGLTIERAHYERDLAPGSSQFGENYFVIVAGMPEASVDRKSTRLNSSHH